MRGPDARQRVPTIKGYRSFSVVRDVVGKLVCVVRLSGEMLREQFSGFVYSVQNCGCKFLFLEAPGFTAASSQLPGKRIVLPQ